MTDNRAFNIEQLAENGDLDELKTFLGNDATPEEMHVALGVAIAYARVEMAEYLIRKGADISYNNYDGVYYSIHNDKIEGLAFAIQQNIDLNILDGIFLNAAIMSSIHSKSIDIIQLLLNHGADTNLITKDMKNVVKGFGTDELRRLLKL